jgi:hypothetical protein
LNVPGPVIHLTFRIILYPVTGIIAKFHKRNRYTPIKFGSILKKCNAIDWNNSDI